MKLTTTLLVLFFSTLAYSQIDEMAKKDLTTLKIEFDKVNFQYDKEKKKLDTLTAILNEDAKEQLDKTVKLKRQIDTLYAKRETFVAFYTSKNISKDSIEVYFPSVTDFKPLESMSSMQGLTQLKPKTTYYLFGDNDLISEKDLIKNDEVNQIFSKVINEKSTSNLGKFEIPALGQLIPVYYKHYTTKVFKKNRKGEEKNEIDEKKSSYEIRHFYVGFEEVNITISEGAFEDIRITLIDKENNKKYYFENRMAASLLRSTINATHFYLRCSFVSSIDNIKAYEHDEKTEKCYITLKDVLQYEPNSGNNYIPDDQNLIFPLTGKKAQLNDTRSVYQLVQDTSLQNTVELRTYTDFLGLFNGNANGIIQMQGKADFYMNPFRFSRNSLVYLFKKITPYANFSKIDDNSRGLDLEEQITATDTLFAIKTPLQIFEKSYLELGVNWNLISFKVIKEMPFKVNFYFPLRYNATAVYNDKEDNTNFKMVSYGGGINLEFKKFSNFGFNYSVEYTNSESINKSETLIIPDHFWVLKNEAELFFFPGESKNQSIFTRFRTFYNSVDDRDSFFQFQFGYRFTIGAGRAKF